MVAFNFKKQKFLSRKSTQVLNCFIVPEACALKLITKVKINSWHRKHVCLTLQLSLVLELGNCDKFYFTFKFKIQMWVWIGQIFKRDWIPIHHLSNLSNLNIFECDKYKQIFAKGWKTDIELFIISHNSSYFSINIVFKIGSMGSVFMLNDGLNDKLFI